MAPPAAGPNRSHRPPVKNISDRPTPNCGKHKSIYDVSTQVSHMSHPARQPSTGKRGNAANPYPQNQCVPVFRERTGTEGSAPSPPALRVAGPAPGNHPSGNRHTKKAGKAVGAPARSRTTIEPLTSNPLLPLPPRGPAPGRGNKPTGKTVGPRTRSFS